MLAILNIFFPQIYNSMINKKKSPFSYMKFSTFIMWPTIGQKFEITLPINITKLFKI